jgi:hypothetical protein
VSSSYQLRQSQGPLGSPLYESDAVGDIWKHLARSSSTPTTVFGAPVVEETAANFADLNDDNARDVGAAPAVEHSASDDDADGESFDSDLPQSRPNSVHLCGELPTEPDHFIRRLIPTKTKGGDH